MQTQKFLKEDNFWNITYDENGVTKSTNWGKKGKKGKVQLIKGGEKAQKLIAIKKRKGYCEVQDNCVEDHEKHKCTEQNVMCDEDDSVKASFFKKKDGTELKCVKLGKNIHDYVENPTYNFGDIVMTSDTQEIFYIGKHGKLICDDDPDYSQNLLVPREICKYLNDPAKKYEHLMEGPYPYFVSIEYQ